MMIKNIILTMLVLTLLVGCQPIEIPDNGDVSIGNLPTFSSYQEIYESFEDARQDGRNGFFGKGGMTLDMAVEESAVAPQATSDDGATDYSETNIQVEGVDEADIIKTDGKYIYALANNELIIAEVYPSENAEILFEEGYDNFSPSQLFIQGNKLLVLGRTYDYQYSDAVYEPRFIPRGSLTSVKLYDVSDKEEPKLLRTIELEGDYVSSRKIGEYVYFVVNSYPVFYEINSPEEIIPLYKDEGDFEPIAEAKEISYIPPVRAEGFTTVVGMSIEDENAEVNKETIVGGGRNIYSSLENLYLAQTKYPSYRYWDSNEGEREKEKTIVAKFELDDGEIEFKGKGEVPGTVLNQFSMDEYEENFRIATTVRGYSNNVDTSFNNLYVLDEDLEIIGEIEDIAPGETIYSARFMGERAYLVTFRHVDPLFVIDLSDPENPEILGKLKIPGYSDYLHPYDENHLIGIGKEVDASIDADKIHTEGAIYYTAIQGVKLAIFDVSDVSNPIELHKEVIGDRGTESEATRDHKAFLFDKEKGLLVVPIVLAELKEGQDKSQQGEFTFNGAYVYDIDLETGFDLRGRVSHEDEESLKKKGYYYFGDNVLRSGYIGNLLWTFSNSKIKLNDLDSLDLLKELNFEKEEKNYPHEGVPMPLIREEAI